MELKSVHSRYLANRISLFALNSQSHSLIFACFSNLCRFFLKFDQVKNNIFEKLCTTKNYQIFMNPHDIS